MDLKKVRVTNFRSVEDSGYFDIGRETRPYTTIRDRPYTGKLAGEANVPRWTRVLLASGNRAGLFAIFKVVFIGHIQSFGFMPMRVARKIRALLKFSRPEFFRSL